MRLKTPTPPAPVFQYRSPPISGNRINGVGEPAVRQATPVFHRAFGRRPQPWTALDLHFNLISGMDGPLFGWGLFLERIRNLWQLRRANGPVAPVRRVATDPAAMSADIAARARQIGGDCLVGISKITKDAVVAGEVVPYAYAISIGAPMNRDIMINAPDPIAGWEVLRVYRRVARIAVELSEQIRAMGWPAKAYGDTKTGELLHIPLALAAGLGQLGKHGSIISREYGSNFRLATVATDLPLAVGHPVDIGVDDVCMTCRRCTMDCPPQAISDAKMMVRGARKWYVDFDRCVPYFAETGGCAICIEVCPWSEPGRGLTVSLAALAKRARMAGNTPEPSSTAIGSHAEGPE